MKKILTLVLIVFCVATLFAQAPEKFSYQAVVRNDSSRLVCNRPVGVQASIMDDAGGVLYRERHVEETNENGLLTLEIGSGNVIEGSFSDIPWGAESMFLRTEIDPTGGENYVLSIMQRLVSVPYALYAKEAANGFSGDYNDLTNKPDIPTVPTNVSAFSNDAGYLTDYTETDPQFNAWDKDYDDLTNKPEIPTVPTNVSAFTNDAGYLTGYTETDPQFNAWDKDYNDLINTPTIPTTVGELANDANYITLGQVPAQVNADWNATGGVAQILNKPNLATVATTGDYNDLTNRPEIPTVPTNVSAFANDAGYLTDYTETDPQFNAWDKDYSDLTNKPNLAPVATSGNYNDLTNKPSNADFGQALVRGTVNNLAGATDIAVTFNNYSLVSGGVVSIIFARNVPAGSSLNINGQGSKPILWRGVALTDGIIKANDRCLFMYNSGADRYYLLAIDRWGVDLNALAAVARTGSYNDLTNRPTLSAVASSGDYNDLINKPVSCECLTAVEVQEMINSSLGSLQNKIDSLQQVIDGLGLIVDTAITHLGFYCGFSTVTDNDGNTYNTVQIGQQCWIRENLRTTHHADGTAIPAGGSNTSDTEPYYYDYSSHSLPLETRGYLYNWPAAMVVCPAGWHLPSDAEWTALTDYVSSQPEYICGGDNSYIAKALASTEGWNADTNTCTVGNDQASNNATGFSAVPTGTCNGLSFYNSDGYAYFWSSTEKSSSNVWRRSLSYNYAGMERFSGSTYYGRSVRCLRD